MRRSKIFRELLSIEEAKNRLNKHFIAKPAIEDIALIDAYGRVAAEDYEAEIDIPPFDRATMDGYAVRAEDTFGAEEDSPKVLKVIGSVEAGENPLVEIKKGEAVEISTGAVMPKGANAVLMVEYTSRDENKVLVYKSVAPGENVMAAGSDIMAGELLVRKETILTQREIGVLSATGFGSVKVYRKPKVAIISSGNELVVPNQPLSYGKIYDINSYALGAAIKENGGEPIFLGITRDEQEEIKEKLRKGLEIADVVVCSGGTSAGVGDLVYRVIDELGEPGVIVHGISVKPGKPTIIAVVNGKPIFGLPGYPTSALIIFEILVAPLIRSMAGLGKIERKIIKAKLSGKVFSSMRREFLPVSVVEGEEGYMAYPVSGEYSAAISALAETDGFIEIPENRAFLEEGEEVKINLFSSLKLADLTIVGSHCIAIDLLLELMRKKHPIHAKVINAGSAGGLSAIRRGEADIAGTHLLDEETGVYNIPFLLKYGLKEVVIVKGYVREQGLIVAKSNPKQIKSIEDMLGDDITIINRNKGSGTRILLDMHLKKLAEKKGMDLDELIASIRGYSVEAKSHTAVAIAVLMGKADVGVGIKSVAARYGLEFIPLRGEEYDFVIRKERLSKPSVRRFIEILSSGEFKKALEERLPGIRTTEKTGLVEEI